MALVFCDMPFQLENIPIFELKIKKGSGFSKKFEGLAKAFKLVNTMGARLP